MSVALKAKRPEPVAGSSAFISTAQARAIKRAWAWTAAHDAAFPDIDAGVRVFAEKVLLQLPIPASKKGSIMLTDDSRDVVQARTQVGLVRSIGPLAFHNRTTLDPWPEGAWFAPGDFVRFPMFGGDRWYADVPGTSDRALFVIISEKDTSGAVVCDPLTIKAYV